MNTPGTGLAAMVESLIRNTVFRYLLCCAVLTAVAAVVLTVNLGVAPPTENKEIRVWKVVSEMAKGHDYLIPHVDRQPHLTKPPLYYWSAILWARFVGTMSYSIPRMPSVIAALALLVLTFFWANQAGGRTLSILAAVFLFSMARFPYWARMATFEVLLALFSLAALFFFFRAAARSEYRLFPLVCLFTALAFLTKGTPVFLIVILPAVVWLVVERNASLLKRPGTYVWLVLGGVLAVSWYAMVLYLFPGAREIFLGQLLLPLGTETESATAAHYEPFYYYFVRIWEITFPVCLFMPLVARRAWKSCLWRDNPSCRFLFVVFATLFVVFSAIPGKQAHYLLPAFLPLAVLAAESLHWGFSTNDRLTIRAAKAFVAFWALLLVLSVLPIGFFRFVILNGNYAWSAILTLLILAASVALFFAHRRRRLVAAILLFFFGTALLYGFVIDDLLVWDRGFKADTAILRCDYDEARWQRNFERYPWLKAVFAKDRAHGSTISNDSQSPP